MQNKKQKIFIIAGEVSGDILGAKIMHEMPGANFVGIGGENMARAGLKSIFPMSDLAVMGVIEVVAHARTLTRRIQQTVDAIIREKPNIVLTIDSPGFARNVIGKLRKSAVGRNLIAGGLRFHHVVAPQVWAWRPGRAKKYAKTFDKLYAFFEFEVPYFTKYGLDTVAVGHPISDGLIDRKYTGNKSKKIVLAPGSRMSEVKKLLPVMRDVAIAIHRETPGFEFIIPVVETTRDYVERVVENWTVPVQIVDSSMRHDIYSDTFVAIVASGTVSAELAMMHVPTIVIYKMNLLTMLLAKPFIRTRWISLVNILLGRGVYSELLGPRANVKNIMNEFHKLTDMRVRKRMIDELSGADSLWQHADGKPAKIIARNLCVK